MTAYAGSKKHTVINILARSQWAGIDGAPETQTLSYDTSLKYSGVGIGFNPGDLGIKGIAKECELRILHNLRFVLISKE